MMPDAAAAVAKTAQRYEVRRMMKSSLSAAAAIIFLSSPLPAHAASSAWHHVEGASIRLVTSGSPDSDGIVRGALEIRLKPGWKTYWRDPGSSGVPPTLSATANGAPVTLELHFPEPQRFEDDYAPWAGYDRSVALAITMTLPEGADDARSLEADAFLGVCETICIPVQARLTLEPAATMQSSNDPVVVDNAFSALPAEADAQTHAKAARIDDGTLTVDAIVPDGVDVLDIFVAGTGSLSLGTPKRVPGDAAASFVMPLHGKAESGETLDYTLSTRAGAVTGQLRIP